MLMKRTQGFVIFLILGIPLVDTQKKLDKALKRNLEIQAPKIIQAKPERPAEITE